jgi:phosphocarrier protein
MMSTSVTIVNRLGLHARAATRLVNCASGFEAEIWLKRDDRMVNGKSIMGVLTLAAGPGTEIIIQADGADAKEATESIVALINGCFGEPD